MIKYIFANSLEVKLLSLKVKTIISQEVTLINQLFILYKRHNNI